MIFQELGDQSGREAQNQIFISSKVIFSMDFN